jgi:threonine synthase
MGLPVKKFVISTNANNEIPQYFMNGIYKIIVPSIPSISSAMNVGHPSNMARMVDLYGGIMDEKGNILKEPDFERLHNDMAAYSVSDQETRDTIKKVYNQYNILIEPHGSVGWAGLLKYLSNTSSDNNPDQLTVTFETAHPAKFSEEINAILSFDPELPPSLMHLNQKTEEYTTLSNDYKQFKDYLTIKFK